MSKRETETLTASMGRSAKRQEQVRADVEDSVIGEMVPSGVVQMPIGCLYRSEFQVRAMGTQEEIDRLAESIQQSDLISPVVVRPIREPKADLQCSPGTTVPADFNLRVKSYEVIAGHHRVLALIQLGHSTVPVLIKVLTDAQAAKALTADNAVKKDLTDWDRYQHVLMLRKTGACATDAEAATVLGISRPQVTNLKAFGNLPEEAQQIVKAYPDKISYKAVYQLGRYEVPGSLDKVNLFSVAPERIVEAFKLLVADKIKSQQDVAPWIMAQLRDRPAKAEIRRVIIDKPNRPKIKISVSGVKATIQAPGIQMDKLQALIEANLDSLVE